jgi:hypothetical protein
MLRRYVRGLFQGSQFRRNLPLTGAAEVIRWWESRRFFFNSVVGCAGVITCVLLIVCAFTAESTVGEPIGMPDGPLLGVFGIFFYGILANVFYTGGWICELLMRATTTAERSAAFGLKAFRIGVNFSIFLTLCPAAVCWLAFAVALVKGQKHGPAGE